MSKAFLEIARDPRIIPGVHHYCDEWCATCHVTSRCLAFRCTDVYRKSKGRSAEEPPFRTTAEVIEFTRAVASAEGTATPELDALLESAGGAGFTTRDPLARTALEYALGVSMWLVLSPDELRQLRRAAGPSPEEVILWFHLRIYMKLTRALVTRERLRKRLAARAEDAPGCAKLTLVAVERSRRALQQLRTEANAATIDPLVGCLDALERGIDERFPAARRFVRVGLDVPA